MNEKEKNNEIQILRKQYADENGGELISCIIITYKQSDCIYDCIKSVLNQRDCLIELIISDDGSPNYSSENIIEYVNENKKDNLIRALFIHNEINIGTVKNINGALNVAAGKYIKIIGGDDVYPSDDVFSAQIGLMCINPGITVVVGYIEDCDNNLSPVVSDKRSKGNESLNVIFNMTYINSRKYIIKQGIFPICNQACCYKTEFFKESGLCDERYRLIEDTPLANRILAQKDKTAVIEKICVYHRNAGGVTSGKGMFLQKRLNYFRDNMEYVKNDIKECPEIYTFIQKLEEPRINEFIYMFTLAKTNKCSFIKKAVITLSHLDSIYYFLMKVLFKKAKRLIKRPEL